MEVRPLGPSQRPEYFRDRYQRLKAEIGAKRKAKREAELAADLAGVRASERASRERLKSRDPEYSRRYKPLRDRWREDHPDAVRRHNKNVRLRRKYGITVAEYETLRAAQADLCLICDQPEATINRGIPQQLAVDHDHNTGRVRGLLCIRCNMMIGGAKHDPAILRSAIAYLERTA